MKTWSAAEILSASDLNTEFNNILSNAFTLISPLTGNLDLNGQELILDADADTSIQAGTDDQIDFKLGGTDIVQFKTVATAVNGFNFIGSATTDSININAVGTDTNIGITITPKGVGEFYSTTVSANETIKSRFFA